MVIEVVALLVVGDSSGTSDRVGNGDDAAMMLVVALVVMIILVMTMVVINGGGGGGIGDGEGSGG